MKKTMMLLLLLEALFQFTVNASNIIISESPDSAGSSVTLPGSMINKGNNARIINLMEEAIQGREITIAAIGGSITAGANASNFLKTSYSPLIYDWWVHKFPNSKFKYVNAGIGATTSIYGVHRAERDLLKYNPDFTMIDFSVNDNEIKNECTESYEGLIRKIFFSCPQSAILSIAMVDKKMENVEEAHCRICKHYQIPMISVKQVIAPMLESGKIRWSDWSRDEVHPNDNAHKLIANLVINYLEECYKKASTLSKSIKLKKIAKPVTVNGFQKSGVYDAVDIMPTNMGSWTVTKETGYWKNSWITSSEGAPLIFKTKAKSVFLGYKKNVTHTEGHIIVKVDGKQVCEIDPNFENGWGTYDANIKLFKEEKSKEHVIEFLYTGKSGEPIYIKYLLIAK